MGGHEGEDEAGDREADGRLCPRMDPALFPSLRRPCRHRGEVHLPRPGGQAESGEVRHRAVQEHVMALECRASRRGPWTIAGISCHAPQRAHSMLAPLEGDFAEPCLIARRTKAIVWFASGDQGWTVLL